MVTLVMMCLAGLDGGVDFSVAKTAAALQQRLSRTKSVSSKT